MYDREEVVLARSLMLRPPSQSRDEIKSIRSSRQTQDSTSDKPPRNDNRSPMASHVVL